MINELRVIIALERAVARVERHPELAEHLIFKGGFVLLKVFESTRFTRDVDALAVSIAKEHLKNLVCESLVVDLNDGAGGTPIFVPGQQNIVLLDHAGVAINDINYINVSEAITSSMHTNGVDYWIVVHIQNGL